MKKIHVLHDAKGRIIAAALLSGTEEDVNVPRPIARRPGHKAVELTLESEHAQHDLRVLCTQFRVHPKLKKLVALKAVKRKK